MWNNNNDENDPLGIIPRLLDIDNTIRCAICEHDKDCDGEWHKLEDGCLACDDCAKIGNDLTKIDKE